MSNVLPEYKRSALLKRKTVLIEEYEAANKQLSQTLGAVDRTRIKRQIEGLEQELKGVDEQLGIALSAQPVPSDSSKNLGNADESAAYQVYGEGNRWAILVGVNVYDDHDFYGPLKLCVKDVEAISDQLITGGYNPQRVRLLTDTTDEKPTRANILTVLQSVANATEVDDLLLFYYSGHGDEKDGESYLVARDGRHLVLGDTAVSVTRIKEILNGASARAKVIILDACHSGASIGKKGATPMTPEFIGRVFEQAAGMAILSSCKQDQVSWEWSDKRQGVFTHYLLDALTGAADRDEKGFVSVQDASRHVTDGVRLWASQLNRSQTPTLQYEVAGDIILADYQGP